MGGGTLGVAIVVGLGWVGVGGISCCVRSTDGVVLVWGPPSCFVGPLPAPDSILSLSLSLTRKQTRRIRKARMPASQPATPVYVAYRTAVGGGGGVSSLRVYQL